MSAQMPANRLRAIFLTHFRNYDAIAIESEGKNIILSGPNGAGKTNILEAISLLSPGRGFRRARFADLSQQGQPSGWVVSVDADNLRGERTQIGLALDTQSGKDKRLIRCDDKSLASQSLLSAELAISWHVPQMDGLFLDSGSSRRSFVDRLIYHFDPAHAARVTAYDYAMRERNRLLARGTQDPAWFTVLEGKMAAEGVAIALARMELMQRLNQTIAQLNSHFPKAQLYMAGEMEQQIEQGMAAVDIEEEWTHRLAALRPRDQAASRATAGPHRSEWQVTHAAKNLPAVQCSTGEQKALLISILLAHATARKHWLNSAPIMLFDEIVAHLDDSRRQALAEAITELGAQCWLTGTDGADFSAFFGDSKAYHVEAGRLEQYH